MLILFDLYSRALKSVLISAGNVKRDRIQRIKETATQRGESIEESKIAENLPEQEILIQSICETMVPKLVAEDIPLLFSLLSDVFPGISYTPAQMDALRGHVRDICVEEFLVSGENAWTEKVSLRSKSVSNFSTCHIDVLGEFIKLNLMHLNPFSCNFLLKEGLSRKIMDRKGRQPVKWSACDFRMFCKYCKCKKLFELFS